MTEILSGKTILYVEDEADLAKIIEEELDGYGASVIRTDNLSAAKENLAKTKFDLIIADFLLKDGTGDTLVSDLKDNSSELNNSTPIIVTSAFIGQDLIEEFQGKVAAILAKPHSMDRLLDKIKEIL
jgi:two-component system response regulator PilR (NtrC family)